MSFIRSFVLRSLLEDPRVSAPLFSKLLMIFSAISRETLKRLTMVSRLFLSRT